MKGNVGELEGGDVGLAVGRVGAIDGLEVGLVGAEEGVFVGAVGLELGILDGLEVGSGIGETVGVPVGGSVIG